MTAVPLALTLSGTAGQALVVGLTALGVFGIAFGLLHVFTRERDDVEGRLNAYEDSLVTAASRNADGSERHLAETKIVQDAIGITSKLATRAGLLDRVENAIGRAEIPLRAEEALFFYVAAVVFGFVLGTVALGNVFFGLVLAAGVAVVPGVLVAHKAHKRLRTFEAQLPDTLKLLAGSLRAGFSLLQGIDAVTKEAPEPTRKELMRVFSEARLGRPVEDALGDAAERMSSRDLAWAVMAIRIQREIGGNLAELLDTVADTMAGRDRLRQEILALTAEGRLSGIVLAIFPPAFGLILYSLQPDYMKRLFEDPMGVAAVIGAAVLGVIGFAWLRKIVAIEV
jgi:tight adherence protein B